MSYQFDSIVNRQEANALKEMIFNRARERAQNMVENIQSDVMELARDSFVSKNNPFSQIVEAQAAKAEKLEKITTDNQVKSSDNTVENIPDIGFAQKQFAPRAIIQNKIINEQISSTTIYNNMTEARESLAKKEGFMNALNYLNTSAAVSLARVNRTDRFEMIV